MSQGAVAEKSVAEKEVPVMTPAPVVNKWPRQFWPVAYFPEYELPPETAWFAFILPGRPNDDGIFDLFVLNPGGQWTKRQSVQPRNSPLFAQFPENKTTMGCWDWAPSWSRQMMEFMDALSSGVDLNENPEPDKPEPEFDREALLKALEDVDFKKKFVAALKG